MRHNLLPALLLCAACCLPMSASPLLFPTIPPAETTLAPSPKTALPQDTDEEVTPEYREAVEEFMKTSGSYKSMEAILPQLRSMMEKNIQSASPDPQAAMDIVNQFFAHFNEDLIDLIAHTYQKYLTLDDLQAYNDFFRTTSGQRIAQAMPQLAKELYQVGAQYGAQKMKEVLQTLQEKKLLREL